MPDKKLESKMHKILLLLTTLCLSAGMIQAEAKTVRYELTVRNEKVNLSGKKEVDFALTVNGGIPAPTLEFTEGDDAEIVVKNEISDEEVSVHWHGILLPPEEDGVAYINTPPIFPGTSRLFKFKIRQNGTFWYHSHTMVQEQKGVYGAFIIHPKKKAIAYDKEAVLVLSDWSDENADAIIRNLRKDGDYYLYKKNTVRSYFGALKAGGLTNQLSNEWTRMGGMDLSDVGYDAFLINGKRDSQLLTAHPGERIRLRIINAGASSYFYVSMGVPMTVISADGVDVQPVQTKRILMGMAETYDVLFTVPEHKNYEIRATVQDVTGHASAWIGMGEKVPAPDQPYPDLYSSMEHAMHGESGMNHEGHDTPSSTDNAQSDHDMMGMDHGSHAKPDLPTGHSMQHSAPEMVPSMDAINWENQSDAMLKQNNSFRDPEHDTESKLTDTLSVDSLQAILPTNLPKDAKVHEIKMILGGDMRRYVWHLNGKVISDDRLLKINSGEIVRFVFVNDTMMHHPMHLHGHFFRVLNQKGDKSPLKHTVDVPPHMTKTIEFYANEPGQWMLHCHNLYHMKTGMARVVRYGDYKLTPEMAMNERHDPHQHEHIYSYGSAEASSNHAKGRFKLMRIWDELDIKLETADIEGKNFSFGNRWKTEGDVYYRRWFSNYFNFFGGGSLYDSKGFASVGVGYTLPFMIETRTSFNHQPNFKNSSLKFRLDLERRFQWTSVLFTDAEFTWRPKWAGERDTEFEVSFMYGLQWAWAAGLMFTEKSVGVGAQIQF